NAFCEIVCVGPIIGSAAYALAATAAVQSTTATSVSLFTRMSVPPRFEARLDISTPGRRNRIRLASGRAAFSQDPRVLLRETLAEIRRAKAPPGMGTRIVAVDGPGD